MRIQIASDLHFEYHPEHWQTFIKELKPSESPDLLILAGDIFTFSHFNPTEVFQFFCDHWPEVIFILGNHEFFYSSYEEGMETIQKISQKISNLNWLHNNSIEFDGQRFLGTPLWYKKSEDDEFNKENGDLIEIEGMYEFLNKEHYENQEFLKQNVASEDVVITHFLPSFSCLPKDLKNSPKKQVFISEIDEVISMKRPKIWIHGHSHESLDLNLHDTRILCNPFGNYKKTPNPSFKRLILDI